MKKIALFAAVASLAASPCLAQVGPPSLHNWALGGLPSKPAAERVVTPDEARCKALVGTKVDPVGIITAMSRFANIGPKNEYETTQHYNERINRAAAAGGPLVIAGVVQDPEKTLRYDADRGVLQITKYAFSNHSFPYDAIWGYGRALPDIPDIKGRMDMGINIDAVLGRSKRVVGYYRASNSFGVTVTVRQEEEQIYAVFERALGWQPIDPRVFQTEDSNQVIGEIKATPVEARLLKASMGVAYSMVPKAPYVVTGEDHHTPTLESPVSRRTKVSVLLADFQCGMVTDPSWRVLGAWAYR